MEHRGLKSETRGVIYVEFLVTSVPILLLFLLMVQLALAFAAKLTAQHAANVAARAAIVVLPDDPSLDTGQDELELLLNEFGASSGGGAVGGDFRMRAIRNAATARLMGVSPPMGSLENRERTIDLALGSRGEDERLSGSAAYARSAVAVEYNDPGSGTGAVTVRVRYLFNCAIPLGDLFLCDPLSDIGDTAMPEDLISGGGRFKVLTGEATLPYQGYPRGWTHARRSDDP